MNESPIVLPTTFVAWERALVDRFLRASYGEDASPLRSFEITGDTLATAFNHIPSSGVEAEAAFREAMRSDPQVWRALAQGRQREPTASSPSCFAYLCMSLLIDTLLDGEYSGRGQYRERLRTWLSTSRSMMQLSGIAGMWRSLASWLDERIAAGEGFRRLMLPDPRMWTQIGYTRRLSFPTRSDIKFLERVLLSVRGGSADPPGLIRAVEAALDRRGASWGMETAFAEFRDAFRSGGASSDHRFWRLVLRAKGGSGSASEMANAKLEIEFDEDGRRGLRLDSAPAIDLGAAMQAPPVLRSANLGLAATRGIVFFRQVGMAHWLADAEPPPGTAHVGVAASHAAIARGMTIAFEPSGGWLLTTAPASPRTVDDLLTRLRLVRLRQERLIDIGVEGGIRMAGDFLGRARFLPRVNAAARSVTIRPLSEQDAAAAARWIEGSIVADQALDGRYEISVSLGRSGDAPEWTRRIQFRRDAQQHPDLGGAAERQPPIVEWTAMEPGRWRTVRERSLAWQSLYGDAADLFEAIYAAGRVKLAEAEVIDLISRVSAGGTSSWDILRAIHEAGFATARQRAEWRGRVWTLEPPQLANIGSTVIVMGATCVAMQDEFRQVAQHAGGSPFRTLGPSPWSPPVTGAVGVVAERLSKTLGWAIAKAPRVPRMLPGRLETSTLVAEHHVLASSWDWNRRRFVPGTAPGAVVSLTRWVHPSGRDHDQYRVNSWKGETRHATRVAAILQAHVVAGRPLFALEGDTLVRRSAEGALPLEFAQSLRLSAGAGGGPCGDGSYVYPLGDMLLASLASALPGCIEGVPHRLTELADVAAIVRSRRSGGRIRLRWSGGTVSVT
ncbi:MULTISPECIES: hypothetical protein [Rhodomicrobium]|uniref:hypothetical protein n=1 Tax=Rhodomicrobium TaxID=1068 RepID=UPI000B4A5D2B|nr:MULTISPECIES: hypothetical protein [Rhodomicrobium]